ncbi:MAG: hypothetical protein ACRENN_04045 [Candidatus Eiseniibacteriota bacterium]
MSFRWTERRAARFATLFASGAVAVADVALLVVFLRSANGLPGGWKQYWYIPAGIALVFLFALSRFRKQLGQFLRDE